MRIQHNIAAVNAHRQLGGNNSAVAKNLEKLSSGYRINKAGDDAAGLSISEKMRAQIKGLETAQKNAQDGVSLIQTAEGNLTEVHSMLNRMVELSTQSANGTYANLNREELQKEVASLTGEIDRIASSANFNGIKLLDGSLSSGSTTATGGKVPFKLSDAQTAGLVTTQPTANSQTLTTTTSGTALVATDKIAMEFTYTDKSGKTQSSKFELTINAAGKAVAADGTEYSVTAGGMTAAEQGAILKGELAKDKTLNENFTVSVTAAGVATFEAKDKGTTGAKMLQADIKSKGTSDAPALATAVTGVDKSYSIGIGTAAGGKIDAYNGTGNASDFIFEVDGKKFAFVTAGNEGDLGKDVNYVVAAAAGGITNAEVTSMADLIGQKTGMTGITTTGNTQINFAATTKAGGGGLTLQVGETSDSFQKVTVSVGNMNATSLGLGGINISTQDGASAAMDAVNAAIDQVSSTRGDLGALQNRLDHTINNLGVTNENMTAAESRIRDVDMAKEMMDFTKNNILTQAAQAMLAQANNLPQGVLQLLK